jgi:hypothetical protein
VGDAETWLVEGDVEISELEAPLVDLIDVLGLLVVAAEVEPAGPEATVAVWTRLSTPTIVTACPSDNEKVPSPLWQSQRPFW